jgi:hypothetical protein
MAKLKVTYTRDVSKLWHFMACRMLRIYYCTYGNSTATKQHNAECPGMLQNTGRVHGQYTVMF